MNPESLLVARIAKALRHRGAQVIKIHGTAFATAGTPDLIGCIPHYGGRALAIEVKLPAKPRIVENKWTVGDGLEAWATNPRRQKLYANEPTPAQHHQLTLWKKAGALAGVARSVADALKIAGLKL